MTITTCPGAAVRAARCRSLLPRPGGKRPRSGRLLALLAASGLLGLTAAMAGATTPALAAGFFVQLSASPPTLPVGATTTLTATTGADVGPTPWFIDIFDSTTGTALRSCGSGTTCSVIVSENMATTHTFVAYVASASTALPPASIQATSDTSFVTWTNPGMRVALAGPEVANIQSNGPATYTATADINVGPTPYVIAIYDETASSMLGFCSTGTTCSMIAEPSVDGDFMVAFIETFIQAVSQHYPPPLSTLQASSNVLLTRGFYG